MCNIQVWFRHLRFCGREIKNYDYDPFIQPWRLWYKVVSCEIHNWDYRLAPGVWQNLCRLGSNGILWFPPHLFSLMSRYDWRRGTAEKTLIKSHETWVLVLTSHPFAVRVWTYHEATQWHRPISPSVAQPGTVLDDGHRVGATWTM